MITLPWPPSANHYWRYTRRKLSSAGYWHISQQGQRYRRQVQDIIQAGILTGEITPLGDRRVDLSIDLRPPDRRRIDIDNRMKPLLDSLQHAGLYHDDEQVDRILLVRGPVVPGGGVLLHARAMDELEDIYI